MDKEKISAEFIETLLDVAKHYRSLADAIEEACNKASAFAQVDDQQPELPLEEEKKPTITLETVRGVLAEKSRDGFTTEVRALITKYGASRLSEIDPNDYEAVLKDAEAIGHAE